MQSTIIQTKKKFGVLVKEEVWLDGDYFTFKFWDCSKEEICFNIDSDKIQTRSTADVSTIT